jgi:hypothetical protein
MVVFGCQGTANARTSAALANVLSYVNAGGRVLVDHYSYVWLNTNAPLSTAATWLPDATPPNDGSMFIQTAGFPKAATMATWLVNVGAAPTAGQVAMTNMRSDITAVNAPAKAWISAASNGTTPLAFSVNTPIGNAPAQQCGRVEFADFHGEESNGATTYPAECGTGPLTPEEKLLEYMIFDLGACISPD